MKMLYCLFPKILEIEDFENKNKRKINETILNNNNVSNNYINFTNSLISRIAPAPALNFYANNVKQKIVKNF